MRLHRFYTTEEIIPGKQLTIDSADLVNQVRRVFRLKSGDKIILFNGTGFDYVVQIANFSDSAKMDTDNRIIFDVDSAVPSRSRFIPRRQIVLYAAIVKKDNFEWIVEKATELGVTDIVPVMALRSEKKNLNEDRLKKIAIEASEQSGRGDVPRIHPIVSFDGAVQDAKKQEAGSREQEDNPAALPTSSSLLHASNIIAFHTEGEVFHKEEIQENTGTIAVFIGPEGGWSEHEIETFHTNNIDVRTLGPQVLRTETAVVSALSQVVF